MSPLRKASLLSMVPGAIELQLDLGWRARVRLVDGHTGRFTLLPPEGFREPRTWALDPFAITWQQQGAQGQWQFCWNGFDPFGYDGTLQRPWQKLDATDPMAGARGAGRQEHPRRGGWLRARAQHDQLPVSGRQEYLENLVNRRC